MFTRFVLIFVLALSLFPRVCSQTIQNDVVYLQNGTFLRGSIIELIPEKTLRLLVNGHDTLEIPMSDVKEIKKETAPEKPGYENGVKAWGYTNITEFTFGFGYSEPLNGTPDNAHKQFSMLISTFNGLTLSPYIQLGIGIGLEKWQNRGFLPIYFDLRANMLKHVNSPFFYANVGYAPGWMKGEKGMELGGALAGIGVGAKFRISKLTAVLSTGYHFQQTRQWVMTYTVRSKATLNANFYVFRMGVFF